MTTHALPYAVRTYAWPSIQKASAMIAERIAEAKRKTRPCQ